MQIWTLGRSLLVCAGITLTSCRTAPPDVFQEPSPQPDRVLRPPFPGHDQLSAELALPKDALELLRRAAQQPPALWPGEGWHALFDGKSWQGWLEIPYAGRGPLALESGAMVLGMGSPFTGIRYTNQFPRMNYEIALEATRLSGSDFFCGLTVPVEQSHCSLIVGGWGGGLVGISSLDGYDASENETTTFRSFEKGRWYRIRLRVTATRLEAWVDDDQVVNVNTQGRRISVRPGDIEECIPLGIASWQTAAAIRNVQWREVSGPAAPPRKGY
ncbi:MAG: DUF1080 domain-containing protein [Verrucomicrobiota bacterium]|nr:DUF1080 domain-containing protein [Limisphaera sp.]MDW8381314.1 DUF1080 domain-containing protein [Verrucomicrobiota bacterium]